MLDILIADDEKIIQEGIKKRLLREDCPIAAIDFANDGVEVLQLLQKKPYDILFLDINMPNKNGLDVLSKLSVYPHLKTIIISGYDQFSYAQKAIQFQVYRYLLKPIQREEFTQVMNDIIQEKELTNLTLHPICKIVYDSIATNYQDDTLSLSSIAYDLQLSTDYLGKLFKKEFGQSFRDYLNSYRIKKAIHILENPSISIKEVAEMTGFTSQQYFSVIFKKITGITPTEHQLELKK